MIDLSLIFKNQTIAVAVSGGKDSMCLLNQLLSLREKYNLTIKAINIDHSIREKDSENDSLFVKNYCEKLGVTLAFFKVDAVNFSKQNGYTLEQGARILRYEIFDNLLKENYCDVIATAHHLSDNFETMLFNIFRGTGLKGLSGIPKERNGYIRPLLKTTKQEICDYIEKNNIPFVEDSTNYENDYSRNFIRNEIIPKILEKFPSAETSASRLSEIAKEEDDFLNTLANKNIKIDKNTYYLPCFAPPVLLKRASKIILFNLGVEKDYESVNFNDILKLTSLENGSKITLPKNVVAVKEYDFISFYKETEKNVIPLTPFEEKTFDFDDYKIVISPNVIDKALTFDKDKIPKNAIIRTRRDGDVFKKFGSGTKKLKDFLIDKKIPRYSRDTIPLLAVDNEILIVFNVEISETIKIDDTTKNVLYAKIIFKD